VDAARRERAPRLTERTSPRLATGITPAFDPRAGQLNLMLGAAGFKFNPLGNPLISANALFPLTKAGLRSRFTMTFGVDYAF